MEQRWTKEQFSSKINILFPDWNYDIIEYSSTKKKLIIKCLNCGKIHEFKHASQIFNRINVCSCYHYFNSYIDKTSFLGIKFNFKIANSDKIRSTNIETICLKCGTKQVRTITQIMYTPNHCPGCSNYKKWFLVIPIEQAQTRLNEKVPGYEIIQYSGITKPALLKHECGFVFKTTKLDELISGHNSGCPKCKGKKSKGEKRIEEYLLQHKINYISQKSFLPKDKKYRYRFDFYLVDYNIAIEYQGEQHFRDNGFAREGLKIVQERDKIKKEYCKENNIPLIEITYKELNNISEILSSKFNDYGVSQ